MNIQTTGRHIEVTEDLKNFINEKFQKLEKHFDHITQCHVIVGKDNPNFTAEAELHIAGGKLFAQSNESSAYASIDTLVSKLDRQLIKHKEKMQNHSNDRFDFREAEEAVS